MTPNKTTLFLVCVTFVAACSGPGPEIVLRTSDPYEIVADIFAEPVRNLDVLFVMDERSPMPPIQNEIVSVAGNELFDVLVTNDGSPMNLHVGVISSDLGTAPYHVDGCSPDGGRAILHDTPRSDGCSPP